MPFPTTSRVGLLVGRNYGKNGGRLLGLHCVCEVDFSH